MSQIIKFFSWILWGIAATVLGVGMLSVAILEGTQPFASIFADPLSIFLMFAAFIPGAVLYMIGIWVGKLSVKDAAAHKAVMDNKSADESSDPQA